MIRRITRQLVVGVAMGLVLIPGSSWAAPVITLDILARLHGTSNPFSSTITGATIGQSYDYEVQFLVSPVGTQNANMPVTTINDLLGEANAYIDPTGSTAVSDGLNSVRYSIFEGTSQQVQVNFLAGSAAANNFGNGTGFSTGTRTDRFGSPTITNADLISALDITNSGVWHGVPGADNDPQVLTVQTGRFSITAVGTGTASTVSLGLQGITGSGSLIGAMQYNSTPTGQTDPGTGDPIATIGPHYQPSLADQQGVDPPFAYQGLTISGTVGVTTGTTYHLSSSASNANIHISTAGGTTTSNVTATVTNDGTLTADTLNYTNLNVTNSGSLTGTWPKASNASPIANGGGTDTNVGAFSTTTPGSYTFTPSVATATNATIGGAATHGTDGPIATVVAWRLAAASAHTPEPVMLGNVHVGGTFGTQALTLSNTAAADGFSEKLDASFGLATGAASTNGASISHLAAGSTDSTTLVVGLGGSANTTTAGVVSGTAPLTLNSDGSGTSGLGTTALTGQTVNISGTVYRLAAPSAHSPEPVNLGNVHVGGTFGTQALTLSNTAAADGFSEKLDASFGTPTGSATATGTPISLLAPGSTDSSSLVVGLGGNAHTGTAGAVTGTAPLTLTSDGTGTSGLGTTPLTGQTVNVSGGVFRLATASTHTPEPVSLGIVHVGESFGTQPLTISNTAANDGFSEKLDVAPGSATGAASSAGNITLLAPGSTDSTSITVGLGGSANTAMTGLKSGTVPLGISSDGTGTSGLGATALTGQTVNVNGQVNQFAQPQFTKASGAGALTGSGASYTLNFGALTPGSGTVSASLSTLNALLDANFQDTLSGTYTTTGVTDFTLGGFSSFNGVTAGNSQTGNTVSFNTSTTTGSFNETLLLHPTSVNASSSTTLGDITLHLVASDSSSGAATIGISLSNPQTNGRFMQNQTYSGAVTGTLSNTALTGNNLNINLTSGGQLSVTGLPTTGTVAPNSSTPFTGNLVSGSTDGPRTVAVTETDAAATNSPQTTSAVTVDVLAPRVVSGTTVTFGNNILSGATVSGTSNLTTSSGDDSSTTRVTVATSAAADANGIGGTGGANTTFNGSQGAVTRTIGGMITGFGSVSGTVNLPVTTAESGATNDTTSYAPVAVSYSAPNVGNATADNSNSPTTFGTPLTATVVNGGSYAGLESKVVGETGTGGAGLAGGNQEFAQILGGVNNGANVGGTATVNMAWRTANTNERGVTLTHPPIPAGVTTGLISDVVNLTGLELGGTHPANQTDPFVFEMGYNPALLPKHDAAGIEASLANNGLIYLVSLNPGTGAWDNATSENPGGNTATKAQMNFQGSYALFLATLPANGGGEGESISQYLGAWGVDIANHDVWAAIDHNSSFAVVPEPATLVLAAFGLLGFWGVRRRKKKA